MKRLFVAVVTACALCASAHVAAGDDPVGAIAESFVRGLVQEEDVGLAFDYFRDALAAAVAGRDLPVPDKLTQRAEAIGEAAKQRSAVVGRVLLDALELSIRELFRNPPQSQALIAPPLTNRGIEH